MHTLRIAIFWTQLTNYAFACFDSLAARPDVNLWVGSLGKPLYNHRTLAGGRSQVEVFDGKDTLDIEALVARIEQHKPDIFIAAGWNPVEIMAVSRRLKQKNVPTVCCADTPWLGTARQTLRCIFGGPLLRRAYDAIFIPGANGLPVARLAGFPDSRIWFNMDTGNSALFSQGTEERLRVARESKAWPRSFVFVGRLVKAKNIQGLVEGYRRYRKSVENPWSLTIIGDGPEGVWAKGCEGIEMLGWMEGPEIPQKMMQSGAFVLPSLYEPWGVVVHEAACCGLPLMLSYDVGAGSDLLRDGYNGRYLDANAPSQIAAMMQWFSEHPSLWEMGERSYTLSKQFSPDLWGDNVVVRTKELMTTLGTTRGACE